MAAPTPESPSPTLGSAAPASPDDPAANPAPSPDGGTAPLTTPGAAAAASVAGRPHVPGYEILGEVGRGGMAVVYKARQISLNRVVTLKMILSGAHAAAGELTRFRAEAEAVARLQHPHIVQIFEVGEHEDRPFIALEFCSGGSLDRKLAGTLLLPAEAAKLVETLARAMHAVHRRRIVHRDLKPANVLLTADGQPKISDFGIAKKLDDNVHTQSGAVLGTPSYMAPEQAGGKSKEIRPATDVYALGAILYVCLTGRPPFRAATLPDTLLQVVNDDPVPPRRLQPKTPRDLETICLKCLQKDPKKRYDCAEALAEDLRRFQAGEHVKARSISRRERLLRLATRYPWTAGLLLALVVVLVLSAGVGAWWWATEQERRVALETELKDAIAQLDDRIKEKKWSEAKAPWDRAKELLNQGGSPQQRRHVNAALEDLETAKQLEDIRLQPALLLDGKIVLQSGGPAYAKEIDRYLHLDVEAESPGTVAASITTSPIKAELVEALTDWAVLPTDKETARQRAHLLSIVGQVDGGAAGGVQQVRDAVERQDLKALKELAGGQDVVDLPPGALLALGRALTVAGADPAEMLKRAQAKYPGDPWIGYDLANCLALTKPGQGDEAVGYYRAVLALRPENPVVWASLARALTLQGRLSEAIDACDKTLHLRPDYAETLNNRGVILRLQGKLAEAAADLRKVIALKPGYVQANFNLGNVLREQGDFDGAAAAFREAIQKKPDYALAYVSLGNALYQQHRPAEAIQAYQRAFSIRKVYEDEESFVRDVDEESRRRHEAAVRYSTRFDVAPQPASSWRRGCRVQAACTAALAGCGQGDAAESDQDQHAQWRRQALQLFQDELRQWSERLKGDDREAEKQAKEELRHWQTDPDLAGVRDADALEKRAESERRAWRAFWAAVEELAGRPPG